MPKSSDKTKGARKRKTSPTNSNGNADSDGSETKPGVKKKKVQKRAVLEGIEMSKQLAKEMQTKRAVRPRNFSKKNNEPRLLGNGQPMPSLAELEALYEDSDDEEDSPKQSATAVDRCSTPTSKPIIPNDINLDSPETLKKITSKVIDIISKKVIELDDDGPPPPVIPQKKPKKSETPYIVGCKERPQVPWAPKTKFCVGFDDYGIDPNQPSSDEDDEVKKRKKRGEPINISKSIFNAKSDEIAERLKELDSPDPQRTGSPDSNQTVDYEFPNSPRASMFRCFSPLPSTSKDSETILKNDKLFNESLSSESVSKAVSPQEKLSSNTVSNVVSAHENDTQDDIEIIDIPCETVVIDDTLPDLGIKSEKRHYPNFEDDCCIIIEPEIKKKRCSESSTKERSPFKDDIYGSIDLTQTYDNEVYEINDDDDIDNLIAESKAILEKDLKKNNIDAVTAVDSSVIIVEPENGNSEQITNGSPSTSNVKTSEVVCHPAGVVECVEIETSAPSNGNIERPTPTSPDSSKDEIGEVVTNFFSQPQNSNTNVSTIDLTSSGSGSTMLGRISSWISSIESFLIGHQNYMGHGISNDVVLVDDSNSIATNPDNIVVLENVPHLPNNACQRPRNSSRRSREPRCSCPANCSTQTPFNNRNGNSVGVMPSQCSNNQSGTFLQIYPPTMLPQQPPPTQQPISPQPQTSTSITSQPSPPTRSLGDCPICMDSLANCSVASTMCGHVFCMPCIKASIRSNGKKCPTCRKPLKGVGYHQLFI